MATPPGFDLKSVSEAFVAHGALDTDFQGMTATLAALDVWRKKNEGAYRGAVYLLASNIVSTSLKLAPADTGYLRASRYVRRPELSGERFTCEIGYGAPYALYVHEVNNKYIVGEWKFLAKAVDYHASTAARDLAAFTAKIAAEGGTIDDVPEIHPRIWTGGERRAKKRTAAEKRARAQEYNKNAARKAREAAASDEAKRKGVRPPRPGRG